MLPALKAHPYKGKGGATRVDSWAVGEEPESRFPGHSRESSLASAWHSFSSMEKLHFCLRQQ